MEEEAYDTYGRFGRQLKVDPGSKLYEKLSGKLPINTVDNSIEYYSACLHGQHIEKNEISSNVKITGRTKHDDSIESIEIPTGNYFTVAYQHHPEAVLEQETINKNERLTALTKVEDEWVLSESSSDALDVNLYRAGRFAADTNQVRLYRTNSQIAAETEIELFTEQVQHHYQNESKEFDHEHSLAKSNNLSRKNSVASLNSSNSSGFFARSLSRQNSDASLDQDSNRNYDEEFLNSIP